MNKLSRKNILLFFIIPCAASIVLGTIFHPAHTLQSPENDGYVEGIELLRKGIMPFDPFRPYLYVYVSAFLSLILKSAFISAKIVSAVSFGIFTYTTYLIAENILKNKFSSLIAAVVSLNYYLLRNSFYASTDPMFWALFSLSVYNLLKFIKNPSSGSALYAALSISAAVMTRYQGFVLFIAAVLSVVFIHEEYSKKFKYLLIFTLPLLLFYLPQAYINYHFTGSFFYSENWKNLIFKLTGSIDFVLFKKISMPELKVLFADQYPAFIWNSIKDFFLTVFFNMWVVAGVKNPLLVLLLMISFFVSAAAAIHRKNKYGMILLLVFILYIILISFSIFYDPRFILPVVNIAVLMAFEGFVRLEEKIKEGDFRIKHYLKYAPSLIIAAVIVSLIPGLIKVYLR